MAALTCHNRTLAIATLILSEINPTLSWLDRGSALAAKHPSGTKKVATARRAAASGGSCVEICR